ncbi:MAG: hypothetical protein N3D75_03405 [Candidatus Aenigmarchaeota archaeon]|nr:hypothetical protein [Candidatus Aenigmarchaeota archaeon]
MAYEHKNKKGQKYYLHMKNVKLKSTGRMQTIYYFSKDAKGSIDLPQGYKVVENPKTGLPFLKKK